MSKPAEEYLRHILDEIRFVIEQSDNLTEDSFMRDKLIHHYFGVDYALVWDVVKHELPELGKQIEEMVKLS